MNIVEIIAKKRRKEALTEDEMKYFVQRTADGRTDQCQIGAMLMAFYLNGMTDDEVYSMTAAMANSGKTLAFRPSAVVVDKHSTGGVGDKVSVPLVPALCASHGDLVVPMVSGRGLGFTGGTLDKLESIPGWSALSFDDKQLLDIGNEFGCFIVGSGDLSPADSVLYRARDVTATVDNSGLIIASIISKKAAAGIKYLVLDLKIGSASFFHCVDEARTFGKQFISVAEMMGIECRVLMTRMTAPIGMSVGNALEIIESVGCLKGNGPGDLRTLVESIGGHLLEMTRKANTAEEGRQRVARTLNDGTALEKFRQMLIRQRVDERIANELCYGDAAAVLPTAKYRVELRSARSGYVKNINGMIIAEVCNKLGAGRQFSDQRVDPAVGVCLTVKTGDRVERDDLCMVLHHNDDGGTTVDLTESLLGSIEMTDGIVEPEHIVLEVIVRDGR